MIDLLLIYFYFLFFQGGKPWINPLIIGARTVSVFEKQIRFIRQHAV